MKCPYHVSFIQQQTLLASITRANNMLLIWFQEAVSRQLRFQLLSSAERPQNVPVPLPQESWQRGAHSCQLSPWNKEEPKQVFLTKGSLTVLTQGKHAAGFTGNAQQHLQPRGLSTEGQIIVPAELEQGAAGQVTQGTAVGPHPSCPMPTSSPSWPFTNFHLPPVSSNSTQHKISRKMSEQGVTGRLPCQEAEGVKWCLKLCTPQARSPGAVRAWLLSTGMQIRTPNVLVAPGPVGSLQKKDAIETRHEALL